MKVLLITNLFPNCQEQNRGIFVKQQASELSKLCDLKVIAPVPWFPFKFKVFPKWSINAFIPYYETLDNIPVYHPRWFITPKIFGSCYGFFLYLSIIRLLIKVKMTFPFDIIYAQWMYPDGFAAVLLGKFFKKPVILHGLGCDINLYSKFYLRKLMIKWSIKNSKKTIVVSEALKDKLVCIGVESRKVIVAPNGVNTDLFKPLSKDTCREKVNLSPDSSVILFIGSLEEVKGVDYLIRGFSEFYRTKINKNILLVIIGQGSLRRGIQKLVKELGIGDKVILAGEVKHEDIPVWLNASDLFCLPSIREGMPNVVLEAMACRKYIVATNVGGIPELFKNKEVGALVPPMDPLALSNAFADYFDNNGGTTQYGSNEIISWSDNAKKVINCLTESKDGYGDNI